MSDNGSGFLEVGTNDDYNVVVNLPHDMTGHVVFSPNQARALADTLTAKARAAEAAQFKAAEEKRIASVPPVDRSNVCTTNGQAVADVKAGQTNETGQHAGYIVLCDAERAKGFVRPLRRSYRHVGRRPQYPVRPLDDEQQRLFGHAGYECFEAYPDGSPEAAKGTGRFWTKAELESGCGTVTSMGLALCETYARDPKFYGSTFCVGCNRHLPVAEFVWSEDGARVGS